MEGQRHWIHIELPKKRARRETGQWDSFSQKGNTGVTRGGEGAGVKLVEQVAHKGAQTIVEGQPQVAGGSHLGQHC